MILPICPDCFPRWVSNEQNHLELVQEEVIHSRVTIQNGKLKINFLMLFSREDDQEPKPRPSQLRWIFTVRFLNLIKWIKVDKHQNVKKWYSIKLK